MQSKRWIERGQHVELWAITPDAELLIEQAGRVAWDTGDKIEKDSADRFIKMLIEKGHESVLEHASATFFLPRVSRALTHQLVRHRLVSYTQRSQRYVNEAKFDFIAPSSIDSTDQFIFYEKYCHLMETINTTYADLVRLGVPKEDARFVLPNACATQIVVTANFRQWRHMIQLRTSKHAQWEIRQVFKEILEILKLHTPSCFADLTMEEEGKNK